MKLKPPGRRKAKRINNRARKLAKFKQSKVGKLFQREKPKGFRGFQAIKKSNAGGLVGKLKLKQKLQDVFTKEGHSTCPEFTVDKNGNKICTAGGSGNIKTTGSSSQTTVPTEIKEKPSAFFGGNLGWGDFSFKKNVSTELPDFSKEEGAEYRPTTFSESGFDDAFSLDGISTEESDDIVDNEVIISDEFSDENKKGGSTRVLKGSF